MGSDVFAFGTQQTAWVPPDNHAAKLQRHQCSTPEFGWDHIPGESPVPSGNGGAVLPQAGTIPSLRSGALPDAAGVEVPNSKSPPISSNPLTARAFSAKNTSASFSAKRENP